MVKWDRPTAMTKPNQKGGKLSGVRSIGDRLTLVGLDRNPRRTPAETALSRNGDLENRGTGRGGVACGSVSGFVVPFSGRWP